MKIARVLAVFCLFTTGCYGQSLSQTARVQALQYMVPCEDGLKQKLFVCFSSQEEFMGAYVRAHFGYTPSIWFVYLALNHVDAKGVPRQPIPGIRHDQMEACVWLWVAERLSPKPEDHKLVDGLIKRDCLQFAGKAGSDPILTRAGRLLALIDRQ